MKKCLIVVDLFKHIIENMQSDNILQHKSEVTYEYIDTRVDNLRGLIRILQNNTHFDVTFLGDQKQYLDRNEKVIKIKYDENIKYDEYYICGVSLSQCVMEKYNSINSDKKFIVKDCCLQEWYNPIDSGNPDHPRVKTIAELVKFEDDFLDGKMRFKFYDNSPGNDGSGEWVYGEFEKTCTINAEDLL
ncbi:hypothetical protein CMI38_05855 [Candidatus Pacearchaeota archaeon]|nr:hypothetical protein [Candidatus Pacearchaeota archaeon]